MTLPVAKIRRNEYIFVAHLFSGKLSNMFSGKVSYANLTSKKYVGFQYSDCMDNFRLGQ